MNPSMAVFLTLFLAAPSRAAPAKPPSSVRPIGSPVTGWALDPLIVRGPDGKTNLPELETGVRWVVQARGGDGELKGMSREDEVGAFLSLIEDVLPAAPKRGVLIYFDRERWGVEVHWPLQDGGAERIGRFEPALWNPSGAPDSTRFGLSLLVRRSYKGREQEARAGRVWQYLGRDTRVQIRSEVKQSGSDWALPWNKAQQEDKVWQENRLDAYRRQAGGWQPYHSEALPKDILYDAHAGDARKEPGHHDAQSFLAPSACDSADLSQLFPEPVSRDQGDIGSCHIFASLAPLEAAIFKMYGSHVRLSEADLFVRTKVRSREYWEKGMGEGGFVEKDLAYAISHGVATARAAPYPSMEKRYVRFRDGAAAELIKKVADTSGDAGLESLGAAMEAGPKGRAVEGRLLATPDTSLERERSLLLRAFSPLSVVHRDYTPLDAGLPQAQDIVTWLCRGVPVAVGMDLVGLARWGEAANTRDARHAFIIKGFRRTNEGLVFQTRNSWGNFDADFPSVNPDISEEELERVDEVSVVPIPNAVASGALKPSDDLRAQLAALAAKR